ncbi:adenylate kinase isoenzyme 1 [Trichonephila clavipes]|nr:adenylate kinase isoenzyme 1 [Trichonephila clavipes]
MDNIVSVESLVRIPMQLEESCADSAQPRDCGVLSTPSKGHPRIVDLNFSKQLRESMAEINVPVIFVIGGPGSGKGTQCERIVEKYGFTHLSTGDLLREECKSGSQRGARLVDIMKKGQLVPNEEVLLLLKEAMLKNLANSKGFLIDGYPREVGQAVEFEKQVSKCSFLLFFDVPDDIMKERLMNRGKTSGRADDNEETITKRLLTFHNHTQPILDHYGDKVKKIPGSGTVDEIFAEVTKVIDTCKC